MALLDKINLPSDLKKQGREQLPQIAQELRDEMVKAVSATGGHLGASLGVVELTIALHYIFDTPKDKLIWDVGHQCYPHKILTGRKDRIETLRQKGGLSGFTKRDESEYDPFGAGHSSTSISAGLGFAVARDLKAEHNKVICVIGDGSMSAGMAYEAMNNAGHPKRKMIVVLNDNDMSIAKPVGAMSSYLTRLVSGKAYIAAREVGKKVVSKLPRPLHDAAKAAEEYARGVFAGGTLFEEMGFYYVGPVDGHNFDQLLPVLENVRDSKHEGPFLVHVVTKKGKGYEPAENATDKMHGVNKFDIITGTQEKALSSATYTKVFAESLAHAAKTDEKIIAITAAMPAGTGLSDFAKKYPKRFFDVGIAEQHAVTFAAGLAAEGFKPFCAIYSSFLQRAYDQIVHDVALQKLPVRFAIDRAGLVGADGATHAGTFDTSFLACVPNMVLMAPSSASELQAMIKIMAEFDEAPSAVRYPRGDCNHLNIPPRILKIGQGAIVKEGTKAALLSYGTRLDACMEAADLLEAAGISTTVADARFAKPLDADLISRLAKEHEILITVEEGSIGGFGSHVMQYLSSIGALDSGLKMRALFIPDVYIEQASQEEQNAQAGIDAKHIRDVVLRLV